VNNVQQNRKSPSTQAISEKSLNIQANDY